MKAIVSNTVWFVVGTPDAEAPFVPEPPESLVVPMEPMGVTIPCRVSNPDSHVILRSVPGGGEMQVFYDNKMGFFGSLMAGKYQCETVVSGRTFQSQVYTVEEEGESFVKIWTYTTLSNGFKQELCFISLNTHCYI